MPYYLNMALSYHLQCELGRPLRQVFGSDFLRIDQQWEPHPSVRAHFTLGLDNACGGCVVTPKQSSVAHHFFARVQQI